MNQPRTTIGRRGLMAGLTVAGAAGAAALLPPGLAHAEPVNSRHQGPAALGRAIKGVPAGVNPIASPHLAGYTYKYLTMWDFSPEHYSSGRAWSPTGGVYVPLGTGDNLWAVADLPTGAVLGDVEWYINATEAASPMGRLWVAGDAYLDATVADGTVAAGSGVQVLRIVPTSGQNGPYPDGTALVLGCWTPNTGAVSINGVRVGYRQGPAGEVLLPAPVRIYDSRNSSQIAPGQTRTHSLSGHLPVGAVGALLNVTLTATVKTGYLKVYSGSAAVPSASSINWSSANLTIANNVQTAVSTARTIKVTCGGSSSASRTHYIVDLVGYLV